jgi:hypothetical protein
MEHISNGSMSEKGSAATADLHANHSGVGIFLKPYILRRQKGSKVERFVPLLA